MIKLLAKSRENKAFRAGPLCFISRQSFFIRCIQMMYVNLGVASHVALPNGSHGPTTK